MKITSSDIGSLLKEIREEKRLTLRTVAEGYGKDNSTISKWETGDNKISAEELVNYVNYLGLDIDQFFIRLTKK